MQTKIIVLLGSLCALIAAPGGARGGPADTTAGTGSAATSNSNSSEELEEIVITAEKRSENLETVPVAVSAFTSKERDLIGVTTVQDITDFTPGLAYSTALDRAFIRGVGRDTNNLATQPGVATYNDGLYNSSVVAASGDPMFIDHVEVLRGPQGTLYGRNSIGGTINAISKHPTSDWETEVRTNIGNYGVYNFEAMISGPINDNLRVRLAGYRNTQEDGWFNNLALPGRSEGGKGDYFYWEGQVEWDVAPSVNFWMKFSQLGYEDTFRTFNTIGSYSYTPFGPSSLAPNPAYGFLLPAVKALDAAQCNNNPGNINIYSFCSNSPDNAKLQRDYQVTPQLTWTTPWAFDVKYIGGYTTYFYDLHEDFDNTSVQSYVYPGSSILIVPDQIFHYIENKKYWSNEIDFTSHGDSSFQWITGLYQYAEHEDQPVNIPAPGQDQLATPFSLTTFAPLAPNVLGDNGYYTDENIKAHSYAVFAQTDWKFLPKWKLTTGLRYNYDKESGPEAYRLVYFNPALAPVAFDVTSTQISFAPAPGVVSPVTVDPATGNYVRQLSASWNAVTGTAGLEWQPTDGLLGYFKYSKGYKAGGLNAGTIVALPETRPEFLNAYELGGKYSVRKFQINQAFFFYDYHGLQIPLQVQPPPPSLPIAETFNIPKVTSFGSESEILFRPIPDWQFLLDYSYLESYIAAHFNAVDTAALAAVPGYTSTDVYGSTVPEAPRHKIAFNSNYTWHFGPGSLNFSASYIYKAHTYDSIFNAPYNLAPSYSTLDFRSTWTGNDDRYTVFVYCHNCANKIAYDDLASPYNGASGAAPVYNQPAAANSVAQIPGLIPPRQYGVEIQYRLKLQ
jgi:iron complex outermembrane receptor protein